MSTRQRLLVGAGAALLLALVTLYVIPRPPKPRPQKRDTYDTLPAKSQQELLVTERTFGSSRAPLVVYEFSDFQCPYCREFWKNVLPVLEREYFKTGKVRMVYVNMPIPQLHPNAVQAHEYAMCVARENHFHRFHDLLYERQADWEKLKDPSSYFSGLVKQAGANPNTVAACVKGHEFAWLVAGETQGAQQSGITGTPSFVLEGHLFRGSPPIEQWRPILDSLYRKASAQKQG